MSYFVAVLSIVFIVLLFKKLKKWRKWWLVGALALVGAAALANTGVGTWLAGRIGWLIGVPAGLIGMPTALLATAVMLIVLALVIYGYVHDKKADKPEILATFLLPLLFLIATGPIAGAGTDLFGSIAALGSSAFGGIT